MCTRLTQLYLLVEYKVFSKYSTNKYSCVRPVHTLYISYFIEHKGDDEPHNYFHYLIQKGLVMEVTRIMLTIVHILETIFHLICNNIFL